MNADKRTIGLHQVRICFHRKYLLVTHEEKGLVHRSALVRIGMRTGSLLGQAIPVFMHQSSTQQVALALGLYYMRVTFFDPVGSGYFFARLSIE
jgi:hypothetical protein